MEILATNGRSRADMSPWLRVLSVLGTVVAVFFVGFFGMGMAALPMTDYQPMSTASYTWHTIGFMAAPLAALLLILRIRWPEITMIASSALALLLPISPFGPAIALTWVLAKAPRSAWAWAIPLGGIATAVPLWRDWNWRGPGSVFITDRATEPLDALSYIMMWVTLFAVSLAGGWIRYYRRKASAESATAQTHRQQAEYLQTELGRQEERDLIAREMHDTVAHHLSIVSLHAGALEVTTTDETVPEVARAVRESAHLALEEMRSLISSLRDSDEGGYAGGAPLLSEWEDLVAATQTAGVEISTDVRVDTAEMPPALARASYRILQEAITNATKHAPGLGISVQIWGGPNEGVRIAVSNWIREDTSRFQPPSRDRSPLVPGGGTGILGMMERARSLGGTLSAGPVDNQWVVEAWMPWN